MYHRLNINKTEKVYRGVRLQVKRFISGIHMLIPGKSLTSIRNIVLKLIQVALGRVPYYGLGAGYNHSYKKIFQHRNRVGDRTAKSSPSR